jgi:hypothetical protein
VATIGAGQVEDMPADCGGALGGGRDAEFVNQRRERAGLQRLASASRGWCGAHVAALADVLEQQDGDRFGRRRGWVAEPEQDVVAAADDVVDRELGDPPPTGLVSQACTSC